MVWTAFAASLFLVTWAAAFIMLETFGVATSFIDPAPAIRRPPHHDHRRRRLRARVLCPPSLKMCQRPNLDTTHTEEAAVRAANAMAIAQEVPLVLPFLDHDTM